MKKTITLLLVSVMILSLFACAGKSSEKTEPTETTAEETTAAQTTAPTADLSSWNWLEGELDCFDYNDCFMSFKYPDIFNTGKDSSSGEQYLGYYYNPSDKSAAANNSQYGVYIYFLQGGYGPRKNTFSETAIGEVTEREIGGKVVSFCELPKDENTGSHAFAYYLQYDEDDYSRIWFILTDPEEDGAFRKTFEESISFIKKG